MAERSSKKKKSQKKSHLPPWKVICSQKTGEPQSPIFEFLHNANTYHEVLMNLVREAPYQPFVSMLNSEGFETETERRSTVEMAHEALEIADWLHKQGVKSSDRVVLVFFPGAEMLISWWACVLLGAIPLPVPPPLRLLSDLETLGALVKVTNSKVALSHNAYRNVSSLMSAKTRFTSFFGGKAPQWPSQLKWLYIDGPSTNSKSSRRNFDVDTPRKVAKRIRKYADGVNADSIAYLQLTSGSTGLPKAVIISHKAGLKNAFMNAGQPSACHDLGSVFETRMADKDFQEGPKKIWKTKPSSPLPIERSIVVWVPYYHDFFFFLCSIGFSFGLAMMIMSPLDFLQNPVVWLQAMQRYNSFMTGGPNFAFEYLISKSKLEERKKIRFERPVFLLNGGEPAQFRTLKRFCADTGLKMTDFYNAYGMAEAVSGVSSQRIVPEAIIFVDGQILHKESRVVVLDEVHPKAKALFAVGPRTLDLLGEGKGKYIVVNPETREELPHGLVGELWYHSFLTGKGYWGWEKGKNEEVFNCVPSKRGTAEPGEEYLATGDRGFIYNDKVFLIGRFKSTIIIRGHNFEPTDIEFRIGVCHKSIREGCCLAMAVSNSDTGTEDLHVLAEVRDTKLSQEGFEEVAQSVRDTLSQFFGLNCPRVCLAAPKEAVVKTTSGKPRRGIIKDKYLDDQISFLYVSSIAVENSIIEEKYKLEEEQERSPGPLTEQEIFEWMERTLLHFLPPGQKIQLTKETSISELGLSSVQLAELSKRFQTHFSPNTNFAVAFFSVDSLGDLITEAINLCEGKSGQKKKSTATSRGASRGEEEITQNSDEIESAPSLPEPIAIIGMGCQLGGNVKSVDDFWDILLNEQNTFGPIPKGRRGPAKDEPYLRVVSMIPDLSTAVPNVKVGPKEAEPMNLVFLDSCQQAISSVSPGPASNGSKTGIWVGQTASPTAPDLLESYKDPIDTTFTLASVASFASHALKLNGPISSLDSTCSSSILALSHACDALRTGTVDTAFVGGISLSHFPSSSGMYSLLSPTGRCHPMDEEGDGVIRGEGCVVFICETLSKAKERGHTIHGLIRGCAVRTSGNNPRLKFNPPNVTLMSETMKVALEESGLESSQISMFEMNCAANPIADGMEFEALSRAYLDDRDVRLLLSTPKANVGHCEAASGMVGLLKLLLQLKHRTVPANPATTNVLSSIDFDRPPSYWPVKGEPVTGVCSNSSSRFGAVNSYGVSRSYGHAILEVADDQQYFPFPSRHPQAKSFSIPQFHSRVPLHDSLARDDHSSFTLLHPQLSTQFSGYHKIVEYLRLESTRKYLIEAQSKRMFPTKVIDSLNEMGIGQLFADGGVVVESLLSEMAQVDLGLALIYFSTLKTLVFGAVGSSDQYEKISESIQDSCLGSVLLSELNSTGTAFLPLHESSSRGVMSYPVGGGGEEEEEEEDIQFAPATIDECVSDNPPVHFVASGEKRAGVGCHRHHYGLFLLSTELREEGETEERNSNRYFDKMKRNIFHLSEEESPFTHSIFLVPFSSPNLTLLPRYRTHGARGLDVSGVKFDQMILDVSNLVGVVAQGVGITSRSLSVIRGIGSIISAGVASNALFTLVSHLEEIKRDLGEIPSNQKGFLSKAHAIELSCSALAVKQSMLFRTQGIKFGYFSALSSFMSVFLANRAISEIHPVFSSFPVHDSHPYEVLLRDGNSLGTGVVAELGLDNQLIQDECGRLLLAAKVQGVSKKSGSSSHPLYTKISQFSLQHESLSSDSDHTSSLNIRVSLSESLSSLLSLLPSAEGELLTQLLRSLSRLSIALEKDLSVLQSAAQESLLYSEHLSSFTLIFGLMEAIVATVEFGCARVRKARGEEVREGVSQLDTWTPFTVAYLGREAFSRYVEWKNFDVDAEILKSAGELASGLSSIEKGL